MQIPLRCVAAPSTAAPRGRDDDALYTHATGRQRVCRPSGRGCGVVYSPGERVKVPACVSAVAIGGGTSAVVMLARALFRLPRIPPAAGSHDFRVRLGRHTWGRTGRTLAASRSCEEVDIVRTIARRRHVSCRPIHPGARRIPHEGAGRRERGDPDRERGVGREKTARRAFGGGGLRTRRGGRRARGPALRSRCRSGRPRPPRTPRDFDVLYR